MNDLVYITHDQPRTNTLRVAEKFGKRHDNILQSIANLDCSAEFRLLNVQESAYLNQQGKLQPCFELTRDGFMFLVMGLTGREAARMKEAFIAAFNAMEAELRTRPVGIAAAFRPKPFERVHPVVLGQMLRMDRCGQWARIYLADCGQWRSPRPRPGACTDPAG